jgi:hypothetical protein
MTTVEIDNDVIITTGLKKTTLLNAEREYRRWASMKHRSWDGNDLYDLYQWMSEPENAIAFSSIFSGKQLNQ